MTFEDFYQSLQKIENPVQKGTAFEKAIKQYFLTIDTYNIKEIWRWTDWEHNNNVHDRGIDLVAETHTGELIGIQCKCYDKNKKLTLTEGSIGNFFACLGSNFDGKRFNRGIIVSTCQEITEPLHETMKSFNIANCSYLGYYDLKNNKAISWGEKVSVISNKELYEHQKNAVEKVKAGFESSDRGQLIMACGTGKTFTSLRIVERLQAKRILFLVPSLNLIAQVSEEYSVHRKEKQNHLLICSDSSIKSNDDSIEDNNENISGTNDKKEILRFLKQDTPKKSQRAVVFCTYQSLKILKEVFDEQYHANQELQKFDLVLCDEAHNITGQKEEGMFNLVLSKDFKSYYHKILFMTATPRIFKEDDKQRAKLRGIEIVGMDDEKIYGKEFYNYRFKQAIEEDKLCDYEILILKIKGSQNVNVGSRNYYELYEHLNDPNVIEQIEKTFDKYNLEKIISFSNTITNSKKVKNAFDKEVKNKKSILLKSRHVDGKTTGGERKHIIQGWFSGNENENTNQDNPNNSKIIKILSNARCLSEGVDVPSVNAVMFVNPKKSTIDIIQAIGRAIRKSTGKEKGYIILPIIIPESENEVETIADSQYENTLQVLLALRSYNDKEDLKTLLKQNIRFVYTENNEIKDRNFEEIENDKSDQLLLNFEKNLYSKILKLESSVRRSYLQSWFNQIPNLRDDLRSGIKKTIKENEENFTAELESILSSLQKTINPDLELKDICEIFIQHILTGHILDVIFQGFYQTNPIAKSFNELEEIFFKNNTSLKERIKKIRDFMHSIVMKGDDFGDKYTFLITLYEGFYKVYDEKTSKKDGIVYTPKEVVDFIIKSTDDLLSKHFQTNLSSEGVDIIDIATGTGSFIFRCLDYLFSVYGSDNAGMEKIKHKYANEIHCNEISLLAYYVASICIEHKYFEKTKEQKTFEGIVYQDTLDCVDFEGGDTSDKRNYHKHYQEKYLKENNQRRDKQNAKKMTVIIGNPPYRANQGNENENNKNRKYDFVDERIKTSYVSEGIATNKNSLYDSYVRFIRWSTERIKDRGIIGFVINSGFIESKTFDGFRKVVEREFDHIYIVDLKGNLRKGEKHNIFDIMTGVCIVFGTWGDYFNYALITSSNFLYKSSLR